MISDAVALGIIAGIVTIVQTIAGVLQKKRDEKISEQIGEKLDGVHNLISNRTDNGTYQTPADGSVVTTDSQVDRTVSREPRQKQ